MDLTNSHQFIDGQFVSSEVHRVVQAIKDYEPAIDVQWLPVGAREPGQPAFKVTYAPVGEEPFILFYVKDESEFDMRVLQRIIANDQRRTGKVEYTEYEAWEMAQQAIAKQKAHEEMEAQADVIAHVLQSRKNTYKVNDDLIIKDGIPFNVAKRRG